MEANQQPVIDVEETLVKKVAVKRKTRKQRLAEEPSCPVCLEELTNETLCKPALCHNICVDCRPVCNKCPLCRNDWISKKQARKKCQSEGCQKMTDRKCTGLQLYTMIFTCDNHVCGRCKGRCVECDAAVQNLITLMTRFNPNAEREVMAAINNP